MLRISACVPRSYLEKVQIFCKASGLTFSEVVRRALDAYLEREAQKLLETAEILKKRKRANRN